jgi:hypothetical protein
LRLKDRGCDLPTRTILAVSPFVISLALALLRPAELANRVEFNWPFPVIGMRAAAWMARDLSAVSFPVRTRGGLLERVGPASISASVLPFCRHPSHKAATISSSPSAVCFSLISSCPSVRRSASFLRDQWVGRHQDRLGLGIAFPALMQGRRSPGPYGSGCRGQIHPTSLHRRKSKHWVRQANGGSTGTPKASTWSMLQGL